MPCCLQCFADRRGFDKLGTGTDNGNHFHRRVLP